MARVVAVTFVVTFAASLATRLGPIYMAAHQTCQQVWITSSLLSDGLAVAIQVNPQLSITMKCVQNLKYVQGHRCNISSAVFFSRVHTLFAKSKRSFIIQDMLHSVEIELHLIKIYLLRLF